MKNHLELTVEKIDSLIRDNLFFDFHVFSYDTKKLILAGSENLTYYHTLEIIFEDVFFVSGIFAQLKTDNKSTVFSIPEDQHLLNLTYEIEQGYHLFTLKAEDFKSNFIIAAKSISFNTDTVYYYNRKDLKPNERIAYFISL
ncbi:hypothetical protein HYN48_13645 [Flavobacterium magnum]|uniref:Uncharacterized protein n=1 Tax=Flavobacterium magnum TaxID=2162713 RepID=A0A2S0RJZ3_9FLAO|nr:hypothetical protein [Flavobacterium magnum]AWA31042.1 hypothetical protein HYN48_13645 [Flavobacterium magnum]